MQRRFAGTSICGSASLPKPSALSIPDAVSNAALLPSGSMLGGFDPYNKAECYSDCCSLSVCAVKLIAPNAVAPRLLRQAHLLFSLLLNLFLGNQKRRGENGWENSKL